MNIHRLGSEISVLNDPRPVPGPRCRVPAGECLRDAAAEPVVVDTGLSTPGRGFTEALGSVLDPADVRWICLTRPDRDHTGGMFALLDAAPNARVVTNFIGLTILATERPVPLDRVLLLNPGQTLDVGDRTLHAFRPPLYDSPATVGFYDERSRACFTSDCFGATLPTAELAGCAEVGDVPRDVLRAGQLQWATVDSPWVHNIDPARYRATIEPLRAMNPDLILSGHLPPAKGRGPEFFDMLEQAPGADPYVGPDQPALERLLASFETGSATSSI